MIIDISAKISLKWNESKIKIKQWMGFDMIMLAYQGKFIWRTQGTYLHVNEFNIQKSTDIKYKEFHSGGRWIEYLWWYPLAGWMMKILPSPVRLHTVFISNVIFDAHLLLRHRKKAASKFAYLFLKYINIKNSKNTFLDEYWIVASPRPLWKCFHHVQNTSLFNEMPFPVFLLQ